VCRDVENSLLRLREGGTIVMHDCNPAEKEHQERDQVAITWNGDVWKAFVFFRQEPNLDAIVGNFDFGVGILRARENSDPISLDTDYRELTWADLEQNREQWLRLSESDEIKKWL
jgi:hypothetical protein